MNGQLHAGGLRKFILTEWKHVALILLAVAPFFAIYLPY